MARMRVTKRLLEVAMMLQLPLLLINHQPLQISFSPPMTNNDAFGAAILAVTADSETVQASTAETGAFQVTNTGNKTIESVKIDITSALYPNTVFDPFGIAGNNSAAKVLTVDSDENTGVAAPNNNRDASNNRTYLGAGGANGFETVQLFFDRNTNGGFNSGETVEFSVNVDPNYITGAVTNTLSSNISGAELIGSKFVVAFSDGTTASGQLQGDNSQGGAQGLATQSTQNSRVSLTINGVEDETLRSAADTKQFYVGAAVRSDLLQKDGEYRAAVIRDFNIITAENDMKFRALQPQRDVFDFTQADYVVNFAEENDMALRGHTLVWYRSDPSWTQRNWSRQEAMDILENHIKTVVSRYRGKIRSWDVVNEAIGDDGKLRDTVWLREIGPEYIELAFQWAHEADPNAKLLYNDYAIEEINNKSNAVYQLVSDLKAKGVPIDGVGFQMHKSVERSIDFDDVAANMQRLANLDLEVEITEADVSMTEPATEQDLNKQADVYRQIFQTCLDASNCNMVVNWGASDRYSWIPETFNGRGAALLFDEDFHPKPVYESILDVLTPDNNIVSDDNSAPSVIVNGPAGEMARVVLTKEATESNNASEFQTVDVLLTGENQDISELFDFSAVTSENSSGDDKLAIGFVASIIDSNNTGLPTGPVTRPIYLDISDALEAPPVIPSPEPEPMPEPAPEPTPEPVPEPAPVPNPMPTSDGVIGEYGTLDLNHNWQTISLNKDYINPVVIVSDPTFNGTDPATIRIQDVTDNTFQLRLQEANYKDDIHTEESASYIVMESGDWTLGDGTRISAGTHSSNRLTSEGFDTINLQGFQEAPSILSQVQTFNGNDWVTTRMTGPSNQSFQLAMQEEEALNRGGHVNETLGWIAIEQGVGSDGDTLLQGGTTDRSVSSDRTVVSFDESFTAVPSVIAKLDSYYGTDTANLRLDTISNISFGTTVHEEQSRDRELGHTTESVSFVALEGSSGILTGVEV